MGKITPNELSESLNDLIDEKLNTEDSSLMTESKTIVGAINEIYGKEIIANAIGEPLDRSDTFNEMGNEINDLLSNFKTNMMISGVTVESGDKFKQLIDKIRGLTKGEGNKGIQYAEGAGIITDIIGENIFNYQPPINISTDLDFVPTMVFVTVTKTTYKGYHNSSQVTNYKTNCTLNSFITNSENTAVSVMLNDLAYDFKLYINNLSSEGFDLNLKVSLSGTGYMKDINYNWYAIGVGVDSIKTGGGLDISIVESLPDTVTENKLCVIAPVTDGMIYVDRLDKDKAVSTYSFDTDDYFVRLVLSENTNTFVTTSTSGNVVERYLVGGIYRYDGSGLVLADNIYKGSNGKWVQIFDVLLVFSNGLQNDTTIVNSSPSSCKGYVSGDGTTLILDYLSTGATNIAFKNSLDITDYNKLVLVVESTSFSTSASSRILFNLYDANTDTYIEDVGLETTVEVIGSWTKGQLIEIDVSSLKGPHYLRINKQAININGTIVLSEIYFTK